jgi:hypothetical protein
MTETIVLYRVEAYRSGGKFEPKGEFSEIAEAALVFSQAIKSTTATTRKDQASWVWTGGVILSERHGKTWELTARAYIPERGKWMINKQAAELLRLVPGRTK